MTQGGSWETQQSGFAVLLQVERVCLAEGQRKVLRRVRCLVGWEDNDMHWESVTQIQALHLLPFNLLELNLL